MARQEKAPRLKRARSDETLLEIIDRDDASEKNLLLRTENGHGNNEIPFKVLLDKAYPNTAKKGRYPVVWISHMYPDGHKIPLVVSHMRTWANVDPVDSMVQFLSEYALVEHSFETDEPLVEEYRRTEHMSRRQDKKWAAYGLWPEGTHDGLVITRATWFLQRR